ncbi:unnamed protein product [Adineta ricciae]|uniref:Uncharacterized protein n=1 Tax=Adineta ricciae TaxID=249248 RepID=A0A813MY10_ADIRI|nr:unnamed protein product [Adineta ricciae]
MKQFLEKKTTYVSYLNTCHCFLLIILLYGKYFVVEQRETIRIILCFKNHNYSNGSMHILLSGIVLIGFIAS